MGILDTFIGMIRQVPEQVVDQTLFNVNESMNTNARVPVQKQGFMNPTAMQAAMEHKQALENPIFDPIDLIGGLPKKAITAAIPKFVPSVWQKIVSQLTRAGERGLAGMFVNGIENTVASEPNHSNNNYGNRNDGTLKGNGFFGALPMTDGSNRVMTEFSTSFDYGKGDIEVPLLNPYTTVKERMSLLNGDKPTEEMFNKAKAWGEHRLSIGKSTFIEPNEQPINGFVDVNKLITPNKETLGDYSNYTNYSNS
jgi:hypothetical protein